MKRKTDTPQNEILKPKAVLKRQEILKLTAIFNKKSVSRGKVIITLAAYCFTGILIGLTLGFVDPQLFGAAENQILSPTFEVITSTGHADHKNKREPAPQITPEKVATNLVNIQVANDPNRTSPAFPLFKVTANPDIPPSLLEGYGIQSLSPLKDKIAYLYPDEWETIGEIYIQELTPPRWTKLGLNQEIRRQMWDKSEPFPMAYTPKKKLFWLDEDTILTLIGFAYGTISTGGDLVKINVSTGEAEMIYPASALGNREVTDLEIEKSELRMVVTSVDDNGLYAKNEVLTVPLNELEELKNQSIQRS